MKSLILAIAVLAIGLCLASDAQAHGGFVVRGGRGHVNGFGVRGGFVGGPVVVQQTNRGLFGRVRSSTTIIGR